MQNGTTYREKKFPLRTMALLIFCCCSFNPITAQTWTLTRCIDSALQNNLSFQQSHLELAVSSQILKGKKQTWLPTLNAGASHGYNWGQTIDPFTNQFATQQVMYERLYVQSSLTLFSGLKNYYTIKSGKIDVQVQQLKLDIERRNLKIAVTTAFFQVLLNKSMMKLAERNKELSTLQLENAKILLRQHQSAASQVAEVEAQYNRDVYAQIKANNDWKYARLLLQQIINVALNDDFELEWIETHKRPTKTDSIQIISLPEVQKNILESKKLRFDIKALKGNFYPSLSINGSLGSGYSQNNKFISPSGALEPKPYFRQLGDNFYQSAFLTLNIPIFNQNTLRSKLKVMELQEKITSIEQQKAVQEFNQKIEQLNFEIRNDKAQLEALSKVYVSDSVGFENKKLLYNNQQIPYEKLIEAKNKLFQSKLEYLQTKFQLNLKMKIKEFY